MFYFDPAAFGRLGVETEHHKIFGHAYAPAAFGWLCVETSRARNTIHRLCPSRLRAAVC